MKKQKEKHWKLKQGALGKKTLTCLVILSSLSATSESLAQSEQNFKESLKIAECKILKPGETIKESSCCFNQENQLFLLAERAEGNECLKKIVERNEHPYSGESASKIFSNSYFIFGLGLLSGFGVGYALFK